MSRTGPAGYPGLPEPLLPPAPAPARQSTPTDLSLPSSHPVGISRLSPAPDRDELEEKPSDQPARVKLGAAATVRSWGRCSLTTVWLRPSPGTAWCAFAGCSTPGRWLLQPGRSTRSWPGRVRQPWRIRHPPLRPAARRCYLLRLPDRARSTRVPVPGPPADLVAAVPVGRCPARTANLAHVTALR
jgi:hypothetical protein